MQKQAIKKEKDSHHPRNKNRDRYDLKALVKAKPALADYVIINRFGNESIDFAEPKAVKLINQAILAHYYGIDPWEFPDDNLCPPIPGRADYIHHIADLVKGSNPKTIKCLDIGTGATCIYPLIGVAEYGWDFVGSDISTSSINTANGIIAANKALKDKIALRLQKDSKKIFKGVVNEGEYFDVSICNPPFHASRQEAQLGSRRKVNNLTGQRAASPSLNFAGTYEELITQGGEMQFITTMITESSDFRANCGWFTTLVSKEEYLPKLNQILNKQAVKASKVIPVSTGNKMSRILCWSY